MNNTLKTKLLKRADELLNLSTELIRHINLGNYIPNCTADSTAHRPDYH